MINNKYIQIAAGVLLVIVIIFVVIWAVQNNSPKYKENDKAYYDKLEKLEINDLVIGKGEELKSGMNAKVNYKGMLTDGTQFDSSYDPGREPFVVYNIGKAEVIDGWNQGLIGMRVGGKRKLYIPAKLGYGDMTLSKIPAKSTLIFEVELIEIVK